MEGRWIRWLAPALLVAAAPLTAKPPAEPPPNTVEEAIAGLDRHMDRSLGTLGPADPGWAEKSLDYDALLAAEPGAPPRVVFSPDKDMPTVWAMGTTAETLLGPDWHRVKARHFGETLPDGPASVVLLPIGPDRVVAAIERSERRGKALCAVGEENLAMIEYERTGAATPTDVEAFLLGMVERSFRRMAQVEMCSVIRRRGGRLYEYAYTPDGRPFTVLNEDGDAVRIEPASRIPELLRLRR